MSWTNLTIWGKSGEQTFLSFSIFDLLAFCLILFHWLLSASQHAFLRLGFLVILEGRWRSPLQLWCSVLKVLFFIYNWQKQNPGQGTSQMSRMEDGEEVGMGFGMRQAHWEMRTHWDEVAHLHTSHACSGRMSHPERLCRFPQTHKCALLSSGRAKNNSFNESH